MHFSRVPLSRYLTAMFIGGASLLLYCGSAFAAPPAKETSSGTHTQHWDSLSMSTLATPPPKETSSGTSFQNWDRKLAGTLRFSLLADLTTRPYETMKQGSSGRRGREGEHRRIGLRLRPIVLGSPWAIKEVGDYHPWW